MISQSGHRRRVPRWLGLTLKVVLALVIVAALIQLGRMFATGIGGEQWVELDDGRLGLELRVPHGFGIDGVMVSAPDEERPCPFVRYAFDGDLTIESYGDSCTLDAKDAGRLMNGSHGKYRSLEDVADPIDPEPLDSPVGSGHLFSQHYGEYTNLSREWEEPVVVIALDSPVDPEFTTLVLRSDRETLSREELVEIVGTLRYLGE